MLKNCLRITAILSLILSCAKPIEPSTGWIDLGKARLYYEEQGRGDAIILIHGGMLDCNMWDDQFRELARHFRVIRYDARNHGRSTTEADTFAHFKDLQGLMDKLSVDKAILMGLSMGGYIASDFAFKIPERVKALILVSPGLTGYNFNSEQLKKDQEKLMEAMQKNDIEEMVECFQRSWTDGPMRAPSQVDTLVRNKVKRIQMNTLRNWNSDAREAMSIPPTIEHISEIKVPTLIVLGELDMPDIHDIVGLYEKNISGARTVRIPDAAHMVNMEKPQQFNREVLRFLKLLSR